MLQVFDQQKTKQALFNLTFGLICVSPILGGEFTGILAAIAYGFFLLNSRGHEKDAVSKLCAAGFAVSVVSTLVLGAIHWDAVRSGIGSPKDTLIHLGWFAAAFMIVDSVRFLFTAHKIDVSSFAKTLLLFASLAVLGKLVYVNWIENVPLDLLFSFTDRRTLLVDMNPNHSDDVVVSIIFVVLWALAVLWRNARENWLLLLFGAAAAFFMLYLFFGINSRAAFAGLAGSLLIILMILATRISFKKFALVFVAAIIGVLVMPSSMTDRFLSASGQLANIAKSFDTYSSIEYTDSGERRELASKLVAILDMPPAGQNIKAIIADACSGNVDEALDEALQIDPATGHRFLLLIDGIRIFLEKPFFGHGAYAKQNYIANGYNIDYCNIAYFSHIHNNYLDIAIRGGLFAVLVFAALSLMLFYLIKVSFDYSRGQWLRCLPILAYFPYLYIESLFGMTFNRYSELIAVQIAMLVLLSLNLTHPAESQKHGDL